MTPLTVNKAWLRQKLTQLSESGKLGGLGKRIDFTKLNKLGAKFASPVVEPEVPASMSFSIERRHYVFGLDWRFYSGASDLRKTLSFAKSTGLTHYAKNIGEDLVGVGFGIDKTIRAKPHSAALQISEVLSRGGIELFLFQIDADVFCITALQDSSPVVGFDLVGSQAEILSLAGEFQQRFAGQEIRQVGNTGTLENEEPVRLSDAFGNPAAQARVRAVPDYKKMALIGGAVLTLGLTLWLIWRFVNAAQIEAANAQRKREQDPNFIYENMVNSGMKSVGLPAQIQLNAWRAVVTEIPLVHKGWGLSSISCSANGCEALWDRNFGNFQEFRASPLPWLESISETQKEDNPALGSIQTLFKLPEPPANVKAELSRDTLPRLQERVQSLASQLQDLALLPNTKVFIKPPDLYPNQPGIKAAQINKPVVRGDWLLTTDLWSLSDLNFKGPGMVFKNLTIQKDEETKAWNYTLTGHYYAKGKDY